MRGTFYTTEKIGPKQSKTPEGFLLCEEVPIARTGMMIYGPDETPIKAGPDGIVKIFRDEEEVFRLETVASAQGKPVTNDHPDSDVTPADWKELALGIAMNVRRGTGVMDDLLLADLLITTQEGIALIEGGKREISCGYEADYEETGPGLGKQTDIIINHIALVDNGRCGPRCAVSDQKPSKENSMARRKGNFWDKLFNAAKARDEEAVKELTEKMHDDGEVAGEPEGGDTHIHVHAGGSESGENRSKFTDDQLQEHIDRNEAEHVEMRARIEALEKLVAGQGTEDTEAKELEGALKEEAPEGTSDEELRATKDSRYLAESFQDTIASAEILAPGIRVPTFDQSANKGQTFKKICGLRRQALDLAYAQPATRGIIDDILGGKTMDTKNMTCDAVRTLFRAASSTRKASNNSGSASATAKDSGSTSASKRMTLAEINARNRAMWK